MPRHLLVPAGILLLCALHVLPAHAQGARTVHLERVYELTRGEGVYAYARISPDGRLLAYASETMDPAHPGEIIRNVRVVDLARHTILFTEPGLDANWSPDGRRLIYEDLRDRKFGVSIWTRANGHIARDVAPAGLGDYFSWGVRDGRNLILTINSNFYYLLGSAAVLPATAIEPCKDIGVGQRPLLSKDGRRITTFVRGTVVVRDLTDCDYVFDTGVHGAKADFSWDGRYIAFHAPKAAGNGYEIDVVDLQQRTIRAVTSLRGSSLFPSWTSDGRLCFRYDGDDYRGFMMASNVLSAPARPLPTPQHHVPAHVTWSDVFPETAVPPHRMILVTVWSTWSAHSADALTNLQLARAGFERDSLDIGVMTATDPASEPGDIARLLARYHVALPRIPLASDRLWLTEGDNQMPATLLFRDGLLVDRRLGAQALAELRSWIAASQRGTR